MRHFILVFLLLPALMHAATITCYSHGKKIYSGTIRDVLFDEDIVIFFEQKSQKMVMIHGECIAKVSQEEIEDANNAARIGD